jgi:hypothetical protein
MAAVNKRLMREYQAFQKDPVEEYSAAPKSDDNMSDWVAHITGPVRAPHPLCPSRLLPLHLWHTFAGVQFRI